MYFQRFLYRNLYNFVLKSDIQVCGLLGLHGIGKTTLVKQLQNNLEDAGYSIKYYDLLECSRRETKDDPFKDIKDLIGGRERILIILDNFSTYPEFDLELESLSYKYADTVNSGVKLIILSDFGNVLKRDLNKFFVYDGVECQVLDMRDITFTEYVAYKKGLKSPEMVYDLKLWENFGENEIKAYSDYMKQRVMLKASNYFEFWFSEHQLLENRKYDQRGITYISFYSKKILLDLLYVLLTKDFSSRCYRNVLTLKFQEFKQLLQLLVLNEFIGFESINLRVDSNELQWFLFSDLDKFYKNLCFIDTVEKFFQNFKIFFPSLRSYFLTTRNFCSIESRIEVKLEDFLKGACTKTFPIVFNKDYVFLENEVVLLTKKEKIPFAEFWCKADLGVL